MRPLRLFGLLLVAMVTAVTVFSASASAALPQILPESASERTWKGANVGETELTVLGGAFAVKCKSATGEGTEEAKKPLGLFHITFKECKTVAGLVPCTGLGDTSGTILALGQWHLVFDNLTVLSTATLFLVEPLVHFECAGKLILVLGSVLCLDLAPLTQSLTHEFHCKTNGTAGDPEETKYWNASGVEQKAELLSSENEGAETMSAQSGLGTVTYLVLVFADH
jgi:hypothetical protein